MPEARPVTLLLVSRFRLAGCSTIFFRLIRIYASAFSLRDLAPAITNHLHSMRSAILDYCSRWKKTHHDDLPEYERGRFDGKLWMFVTYSAILLAADTFLARRGTWHLYVFKTTWFTITRSEKHTLTAGQSPKAILQSKKTWAE